MKAVHRLAINWAASFLSAVILLSMVATPALAYVAANQVVSSSIKDGSILNRDIKQNIISSSRIMNYTIRKQDIHSGSINTYKILDGSILGRDIAAGVITNSKLAANAVTSDRIQDNSILNRDIAPDVISSSRVRDNTLLNRDIKADVITSSRIRNGTISDADISPSAAISDLKLSWTTKTVTRVIQAADFRAEKSSDTWGSGTSDGSIYATGTSAVSFLAPVNLPNGAVIKKVTANFMDSSTSDATFTLKRTTYISDSHANMASISSSGTSGWANFEQTTIAEDIVDNASKRYFGLLTIPGSTNTDLKLGAVMITYKISAP